MFSLCGSEDIATLLAAKVNFPALPLILDGLQAGHKFLADRILLQGVTDRHFRGSHVTCPPAGQGQYFPAPYQPVGDVDENDQDDYP
jgi:hypothetical protein